MLPSAGARLSPIPGSVPAAQESRISNEDLGRIIQSLGAWATRGGADVGARVLAHAAILKALAEDRAAKDITVVYSGEDQRGLIAEMRTFGIRIDVVRNADDISPPAFDFSDAEPPPPAYEKHDELQHALEMSASVLPGVARIPEVIAPLVRAEADEIPPPPEDEDVPPPPEDVPPPPENYRHDPVPPPGGAPRAHADAPVIPPLPENAPPSKAAPARLVDPGDIRLNNDLVKALQRGNYENVGPLFESISHHSRERAMAVLSLSRHSLVDYYAGARRGLSDNCLDALSQYMCRLAACPQLSADDKRNLVRELTQNNRNALVGMTKDPAIPGAIIRGILQSNAPPSEKEAMLNQVGFSVDEVIDLLPRAPGGSRVAERMISDIVKARSPAF